MCAGVSAAKASNGQGAARARTAAPQRRRQRIVRGTFGDDADERGPGARLRGGEGGLDFARGVRVDPHHQLPDAPPPPDDPPPPENPLSNEPPPDEPPPEDQPPVLIGTIQAPPVRLPAG